MTKPLFCANCQADTDQKFEVHNRELISTCGCGRQLHWPVDVDAPALRALFDAHKVANTGQIHMSKDGTTELHPVLDVLASL